MAVTHLLFIVYCLLFIVLFAISYTKEKKSNYFNSHGKEKKKDVWISHIIYALCLMTKSKQCLFLNH